MPAVRSLPASCQCCGLLRGDRDRVSFTTILDLPKRSKSKLLPFLERGSPSNLHADLERLRPESDQQAPFEVVRLALSDCNPPVNLSPVNVAQVYLAEGRISRPNAFKFLVMTRQAFTEADIIFILDYGSRCRLAVASPALPDSIYVSADTWTL